MKNILDIAGNKIKILLILSVPIGLACGLIEIVFAISLNDVLINYSLIEGEKKIDFIDPLYAILIFGFVRFVLFFLSQIISNLIFEFLNQKIRSLVIINNYNFSNTIGLVKSQLLLNNVTNKIAEFLNSGSQLLIQGIIFLTLYFFLFKQSIQLTFISSIIFVVLFAPLLIMKKRISLYSLEFRDKVNFVLSKIFKDIRNINFLKTVGSLNNERELVLNTNEKSIKPFIKYNLNLGFVNQLPNFFGILVIVFIIILNSKYSFIEIGNMVPFLYLILRSIMVFGHITYNIGRIIFGQPYVKMLLSNFKDSKMQLENHQEDLYSNKKIVKNYKLEVNSLSIGYDKTIIKDLNFNIEKGNFCLITGESGVGKTALLATLVGIIKPHSGDIFWGNININDLNLDEFRKTISYCSTDPYLIEGTIRENILYGNNMSLNNSIIEECLALCECDFLKKNQTYDLEAKIKDDGSGLSSGQKQRLSLARAILNSPKVIILDEATVNIDENIEEKIILNIKKILPDSLILAISHRNSLRKYADKIISM